MASSPTKFDPDAPPKHQRLDGAERQTHIRLWNKQLVDEQNRLKAEARVAVRLPEDVEVRRTPHMPKVMPEGDGGLGLFSLRAFAPGEVVYYYPSVEWPRCEGAAHRYAETVDMRVHNSRCDLVVRITREEHAELFPDGSGVPAVRRPSTRRSARSPPSSCACSRSTSRST